MAKSLKEIIVCGSLVGDCCWDWNGAVGKSGYGISRIGNRSAVSCHRIAWEAWRGAIPNGLIVLHNCDNKRCVNPSHLYLGNYSQNAIDAVVRGQSPVGSKKFNSSFTDDQVRSIRLDERRNSVIASELGVHRQDIWRVKTGFSYKSVK